MIAAGKIGKRLQQAMAKELLREPRPAQTASETPLMTPLERKPALPGKAEALVEVGQRTVGAEFVR